MSWFDEQIKERKATDRVSFDAARSSVENAINSDTEKIKRLPRKTVMQYIRKVLTKRDFAVLSLTFLLLTLAMCLTPLLIKLVIENDAAILPSLLCIGSSVLIFVFAAINDHVKTKLEIKKGSQLQKEMLEKTLSLPTDFISTFNSGELAQRINSVDQLSSAVFSGLIELLMGFVSIIIFVVEIAFLSKSIIYAGISMLLLTAIIVAVYTHQSRIISSVLLKYDEKESAESIDIISGIQKIRLSGSERRSYVRWGNLYSKVVSAQYAPPLFIKLTPVFIIAADMLCTILIYITSVNKGLPVSDFYAVFTAYGLISTAAIELLESAGELAYLEPIISLIQPIFEAKPEVLEDDVVYSNLKGEIEVNDLVFSYDKTREPLIKGISFHVNPGEYVAICGESGCGKSTLLKLLLGFLSPDSGSIKYDGKDITEYNIKALRKQLATVMQDGKVFHDDIRNNILISAPEKTDADALDALDKAQFSNDLKEMPMGLDTYLAEGDGGISGGQRQRLLIARAIVTDPTSLILDEATSALDNVTQRKVTESMDNLNCTRIAVAHRLSTIKNADKIILLSKGTIAEQGTYEELLELNGIFAKLVERQRLDL